MSLTSKIVFTGTCVFCTVMIGYVHYQQKIDQQVITY